MCMGKKNAPTFLSVGALCYRESAIIAAQITQTKIRERIANMLQ